MSEVKTLVTLVLGGMFDHNELSDIDLVYEAPACEALQRELVTDCDDVHVELVSRMDYDTAQSELAALREELAQVKKVSIVEIIALNGVIDRNREEIREETYKAELYDEVWPKATGMGFMNITMALAEIPRLQQRLADAERRNVELLEMLHMAWDADHVSAENCRRIDAALNPNPEAASHDE